MLLEELATPFQNDTPENSKRNNLLKSSFNFQYTQSTNDHTESINNINSQQFILGNLTNDDLGETPVHLNSFGSS
jgi:hypothetical protein